MTTAKSNGGNQYTVTINGISENVDLDGITIISDEDYKELAEKAGIEMCHGFLSPQHADGNEYWEAAANEVVCYSSFDVDEFIAQLS